MFAFAFSVWMTLKLKRKMSKSSSETLWDQLRDCQVFIKQLGHNWKVLDEEAWEVLIRKSATNPTTIAKVCNQVCSSAPMYRHKWQHLPHITCQWHPCRDWNFPTNYRTNWIFLTPGFSISILEIMEQITSAVKKRLIWPGSHMIYNVFY